MADWTTLPNTAVGVGGLPSGTTVTALRDNPVAIAEGAAGAPRNVPDSLNFLVGSVNPSGLANVTFINLPETSLVFEFTSIQPESTANRSLQILFSTNNGSSFTTASEISQSINWQARGLSGMVQIVNSAGNYVTGEVSSINPQLSILSGGLISQLASPFQHVNAIRFQWSSGSFRSAANQVIRAYAGGYRHVVKP
jgi:hypothetical protein